MNTNQQRFKFLAGSSTWAQKRFECADPSISQEMDAVASNGVLTALPWKANSSIAIFPAYQFRRFDNNLPLIKGHTGAITDVAFSPFVEQLLASTSDDGSCKLWVIPSEGITEHLFQFDAELKGHTKKVNGLAWHRTADNVLATHAADCHIKIWDVENQKSTMSYTGMNNFATAMRWSPSGNRLAVSVKGGAMQIFDPRVQGSSINGSTHLGPKACKLAWIDDEKIITSGSNKQAEREYAIWDSRNLSQKIAGGFLGTGLGVGHLFFDEQHKVLFSAGRGEQQIGIWQYDVSLPNHLFFLSNYSGNAPSKGVSIMPKQCLDPEGHEVNRFVRIDNKGLIEYLSFRLPNRTGQFQNDLYPEFQGPTPSSDYTEWATGVDKPAIMMRLHQGMEDAELHSLKKSAFLAKIKPKGGASVATVNAGPSKVDEKNIAKIAELQDLLDQVTKENQVLKVPLPPHNLNLSTKPILGYWNIRGLGAPIRYLLYYCGVQFEDKMYIRGPKPEYNNEMWLGDKFSLGFDLPNLPYFIDGEEIKLTETTAIMKYICAKWKPELLLGKDPITFSKAEMISFYVSKLNETARVPVYSPEEVSNQSIMDSCWPLIENLVTVLGENTWLAGKALTWLDFFFFEVIMYLDMLSGEVVKTHYTTLGAYCERFINLPGFAEAWADDSKAMKWPFNGDMAKIGGRDSQV